MSIDRALFAELTKTAYSMPSGPEKSKLIRVLIAGRRHLDKAKIAPAADVRDRLVKLAYHADPETRARLLPLVKKVAVLTHEAKGWSKLPKGWTQDSVKKFWEKMTGNRKHKVTACIKKMEGKMDDPGAFCASLADMMDPGWRSKKKASQAEWVRIFDGLKPGQTVQLAMKSVMGTSDLFDGRFHDYKVGRRSVSKKHGVESITVQPAGEQRTRPRGAQIRLNKRGDKLTASEGNMAVLLQGIKTGSGGKSSAFHDLEDVEDMDLVTGESDIEPTHARKQWPELPPGVQASAKMGCGGSCGGACGCEGNCGGACSCAKDHVDTFVSENPDLESVIREAL